MFASNEEREWILSAARKELNKLRENPVTFPRKLTSGQTLNLITVYEKINGCVPESLELFAYLNMELSEYEFVFGKNFEPLVEAKVIEIDNWFEKQENWVARKLSEEQNLV